MYYTLYIPYYIVPSYCCTVVRVYRGAYVARVIFGVTLGVILGVILKNMNGGHDISLVLQVVRHMNMTPACTGTTLGGGRGGEWRLSC